MTENSISDKPKSTSTTKPSKASSTEAEAAPEPTTAPVEAGSGLGDYFPGYLRRKRGFAAAAAAMETARGEANLPSFNPTDYRFEVGQPGGVPFSIPVQVTYKPDSPDAHDLGTFRVGR